MIMQGTFQMEGMRCEYDRNISLFIEYFYAKQES